MTHNFTNDTARQIIDGLIIPNMPNQIEGRGIVLCAGGRYNVGAYLLIRLLRDLKCELPIQLWHLPHEKDELFEKLVSPFNVQFVDAGLVMAHTPYHHMGGWELKGFAIRHCPFAEVLFLDADNYPTRNPEYLFDSQAFKDYGCIFFPDVRRCEKESPFWKVFGLEARSEFEWESGAMYIDRSRNWKEICIMDFINEYGMAFYWPAAGMLGDKDSWRASFYITGKLYGFIPHPVAYLGSAMLQYDFNHIALFQHRNLNKFNLYDNQQIPGFQHEGKLFDYLAELKVDYLTVTPEPCDFLINKKFQYIRLGIDSREVIFGNDGLLSKGSAGRESRYYGVNNGTEVHLIGEDGVLTAVFRRTTDPKIWLGRWQHYEQCPVILWESS